MTLAVGRGFLFAVWRRVGVRTACKPSVRMEHKKIKKFNLWLKRRSRLPLIAVGTLVVMLLVVNEDTSVTLSMEYEREIISLRREIKECRDSAAYFRARRLAIEEGKSDLEHIAREQYHMQKPTEDVFVLR